MDPRQRNKDMDGDEEVKKKKNPHKIPATQADVERATVTGVERGLLLFLWTLVDKHNPPADEIRQFAEEVNDMADSIRKGYVTWADITETLEDEYGVKIRLR